MARLSCLARNAAEPQGKKVAAAPLRQRRPRRSRPRARSSRERTRGAVPRKRQGSWWPSVPRSTSQAEVRSRRSPSMQSGLCDRACRGRCPSPVVFLCAGSGAVKLLPSHRPAPRDRLAYALRALPGIGLGSIPVTSLDPALPSAARLTGRTAPREARHHLNTLQMAGRAPSARDKQRRNGRYLAAMPSSVLRQWDGEAALAIPSRRRRQPPPRKSISGMPRRFALSARLSVTPEPGKTTTPIGTASSSASLRLNGAALACRCQSGL